MMRREDESAPIAGATPISRRTAMLEIASIGIVLGVPIAAVVSTARPIADPPNRKTLDLVPPARAEAEEQLRQETKRRRAAAKEAEAAQEAEAEGSQRKDRDKDKRPRSTEPGASNP